MRRFCAKCGADDPGVIDGLCLKCLLDEGRVVRFPKEVRVAVCRACGSVKSGSKWLNNVDLTGYVRNVIRSSMEARDGVRDLALDISIHGNSVMLHVRGVLGGFIFERDFSASLSIDRVLCPRCARIRSTYYDALVQIRTIFKLRDVFRDSVVDRIIGHREVSRYISDIEVVRDGVDVKLISQGVARKLASSLVNTYGGTLTESWSKAGFSSGRRVSKLTISTRLLGLLPGDIVLLRGSVAIVHSLSDGVIKLRLLGSDKLVKCEVRDADLASIELLDDSEYELVDARVINVAGNKVTVRDLKRGVVYELPSVYSIPAGSEVRLLIYRDSVYLT